MTKNPKTKITFLDSDLAQLFANLESTKFVAVNMAIFLQTIDHLIRKSGKKSILTTAPKLHELYFPYWGLTCMKRNLQRLRKLGILQIRVEYKGLEHKSRIWINNKKITELAEQVKRRRELGDMAKRLTNDADYKRC